MGFDDLCVQLTKGEWSFEESSNVSEFVEILPPKKTHTKKPKQSAQLFRNKFIFGLVSNFKKMLIATNNVFII